MNSLEWAASFDQLNFFVSLYYIFYLLFVDKCVLLVSLKCMHECLSIEVTNIYFYLNNTKYKEHYYNFMNKVWFNCIIA